MIEFENENFETEESLVDIKTDEDVITKVKKTCVTSPKGNIYIFYGEKDEWFESFKYWAIKEL